MLLKWIEPVFKVSGLCHIVIYLIGLWWGFMGVGLHAVSFLLLLILILVNKSYYKFTK